MKKTALNKSLQTLSLFRQLDPEMPMQMASVFIRVAMQPGITMKDIGQLEGLSQASCSRNISALSKTHRLNKPGHDLVVATEDPVERRRKVVMLTPKGQRLAESLISLWEI